ncbi:hypothetical protein Scep_021356 [Stephania cephalantha]|uniref:Uncharacterized protein n=1 Tax=Stephania cephalantha TaxID=152367 RepID=A0AAP0F5Z4_9MAGN
MDALVRTYGVDMTASGEAIDYTLRIRILIRGVLSPWTLCLREPLLALGVT